MRLERYARRALGVLVMAGSLSACVTLPPNSQRSPHDPWESWNRGVYRVNDKLDRAIAKPVAKAYVKVVPQPVRTGVNNVFENANTPTVMFNDVLQGKFKAALSDLGRFLVNSTFGIVGIFDLATPAGIAKNDEDFGQTLGKWGVPLGPFLELPLLGPSSLRDAPARVVDSYTNPRQYIKNNWIKYGLYVPDVINRRANLLSLDETLQNVYDPYAFIRDAYVQRRAYLVSDGKDTGDEPLVDPEAGAEDGKPTPAPVAPTPSDQINPKPAETKTP